MADKPKVHTLVVRAPAELVDALDAIGQSQQIPVNRSQVVIAALREYVDRHKVAQKPPEPLITRTERVEQAKRGKRS